MLSIALLDTHWKVLQPLIESYGDAHEVKFDATPLSHEELYSQLSLALTQRADTFDVVLLDDPWLPQFTSFLTSLDISSDTAEAIVPVAMDVSRYPDGARSCAMPVIGESQFFALRPDWLQAEQQVVPTTWDETLEAASTIAAQLDPDEKRAAFGMRTLSSHHIAESFIPILRGYGKALIDGDTSVPQLDTPAALAAVEAFLTLVEMSPVESAAVGELNNAERFEQGDISMMSNFWSNDLLASRSSLVEGSPGDFAVRAQPAQPSIANQTMTGVWLAGIPVGSAYPDVARSFIDWLVSADLQRELLNVSLPPVRDDVLSDVKLIDRFPDLPNIREMLVAATPRTRSPFYPQLEHLLATELGKALSGELTGANAMKNANIAIREFLVREGVLES